MEARSAGWPGRPIVVVLLAAYQGTTYLAEQLASILGQRDVDVRVVVSVDASTDGTERLVDSFAGRDPRITALPHGRRFGAAAPNFYRLFADAEVSDADAVALADQDDVWYPDKLARACAALRSGDGYSSNVNAWFPDGQRMLVKEAAPQRRVDHLFQSAGPGCSYVVRAELFAAFRAWCGEHASEVATLDYHDWLLYAWAREHGYRWIIDPQPSLDYRQHDANQLGANAGWQAVARRVQLARSGWYSGQVVSLAHLLGRADDPAVRALTDRSLRGRLALARQARDLRRAASEQVALIVLAALESLATSRPPAPRRHPLGERGGRTATRT